MTRMHADIFGIRKMNLFCEFLDEQKYEISNF
jgi:hypothetical protein